MSKEHNRYREEEKEIKENDIEQTEEEITKDNDQVIGEDKVVDEEIDIVTKLQTEISNLNDLLLRNRAELENFKRRNTEERIKDRMYALQDFFTNLIPIVDIFDKAVSMKTDDDKLKNFLIGFQMINGQLQTLLSDNGVKKIETSNKPFNPAYHSAMETIENDEVPDGTIIEEVMTGYTYKDRVLRPSMVKVSKKTKEENNK